jgi:hypothetical protein
MGCGLTPLIPNDRYAALFPFFRTPLGGHNVERTLNIDWEHVCILSSFLLRYTAGGRRKPQIGQYPRNLVFISPGEPWQHVTFHPLPESSTPLLTEGTSDNLSLYGYEESQIARIQWGPLPEGSSWLEAKPSPENPKGWVLHHVVPEGHSSELPLDMAILHMLEKRPLPH